MAGGIGAVWLLAVRPAAGLEPPTSPGLAVAEFLLVGLIAGYLVFLQLRRLVPRSSATDDYLSRACTSTEILAQRESLTEEDRLNTIGAVVDRLHHKLNNALMVIRGQAEVFLRREPEGPNSQGLSRIIEQVDVINNELKALDELKKIETEPYYGDHLMLSIPEKEEEPPEIS
ncbi:MAG: hypothetical protein KAT18_02670 [Candidatus Latescibacteria bacterium]|nr:hypothetical protein [Candidatus Latescibacterota bacterium]